MDPGGAIDQCMVLLQSLEAMQGAVQQKMSCLRAERSTFKDLVHDAKWAACQAGAPDQASVSFQSQIDLPAVLARYLLSRSRSLQICTWCCFIEKDCVAGSVALLTQRLSDAYCCYQSSAFCRQDL